MSLDSDIRIALESHLAGTTLATTGARSDLAATAAGYQRGAGSFVADGFRTGDTIEAAGFADPGFAIVLAVSDLALVVDRDLETEAAGEEATIRATLPEARKFEGQPFQRPDGRPWLRTTVRHVGAPLVAYGGGGLLRHHGSFLVELFQPVEVGRGMARVERLADGLRARYRAGTRLESAAATVRIEGVRRGPIQEARDFLSLPVSIEWFCHAAN